MIQDIAPHKFTIGYEHRRPAKESDFGVILKDGRVLVRKNGGVIPTLSEMGISPEGLRYLCMIDEDAYFLAEEPTVLPEDLEWKSPMDFREAEPQHLAFGGISAVQIARFYRTNRFCPTCGTALVPKEEERALQCPACKRTLYPRISPAVICAVVDGERIVLTKYAGRAFKRYALVAGFCEVGETPEETAKREVFEETGLIVDDIHYYKCQPWSFSETLLVGLVAHLAGPDAIHMDENELSVAEWVNRKDIPDDMGTGSLTREMILAFRDGKIG